MVLLDQYAIIETGPVVGPATDPNRVLFEYPESGRGLAGINDPRFRTGDCSHKSGSITGYAAHTLHKVESHSLPLEQHGSISSYLGNYFTDWYRSSIRIMRCETYRWIKKGENLAGYVNTGQYQLLFGDEASFGWPWPVKDRCCCDVTGMNIFGEGCFNDAFEEFHGWHL
jgi:hypothetical protein